MLAHLDHLGPNPANQPAIGLPLRGILVTGSAAQAGTFCFAYQVFVSLLTGQKIRIIWKHHFEIPLKNC